MIMAKKSCYIFLFLTFVLCVSLSFSVGAEDQGKYGGTLVVGIADGPPTLDWQWSRANSVRHTSKYIWEGFVVFDANDEIQPMLAKKWELSEDGLVWTFYLREGILFHNGKEMTSEDAVVSARRWVEIGPFRGVLGNINSINAIDKYTVEFKLDDKLGSLPILMAMRSGHCIVMPKEVCEGVPAGKITEYIGTGPYKFVWWKLDQEIKLEKFKDYKPLDSEPSGYAGKKNAYLDEIIVKFIPETSTLLAGLETGELDIIEPILPMSVDRLSGNKEIVLQRYPKWSVSTVFNTKAGFQDPKLRQAAVMALDMEEIMLTIGKKPENIELASSSFRKNSIWYTGQREKYYNQKNIEGAKKLMQEAGYNGEELTILTTKHYPWAFDMAISIVDQLTKIGFNFKMDVVDWPTLVSKRAKPEGWDVFTTAGSPSPDPVMMAQNFMGNYPGWFTSPEIVEQMNILTQESNFEKRFSAWSKVESLLGDNPFSIKPGYTFEFRGYRSNIKGLPEFNEGIFWNVYKE